MTAQVGFYEAWRDLMRSWGHAVHESAGWHTRDAEPRTTYLPGRLYVEHHDASTIRSGNWGALAYIVQQRLANIVTARNGEVMLTAAGVAWHAGQGGPRFDVGRNAANPASMGNEVANSGSEPYSDACTRSVIDGEAAWAIVSGRTSDLGRILGHYEWATPPGRKIDPRVAMEQRRRDVELRVAVHYFPPKPAPSPGAPLPAGATHAVVSGETLYRIAVRYGVTVAQLRQWNGLASDTIRPGQQLLVAPVPAGPPAPAPATHFLPGGGVLRPGQALVAGEYVLSMQGDGNLVIYRGGRAEWATRTDRNPGAFLAFQTDGNAVVYSSAGRPLWNTGTHGRGGNVLVMQADGNLVIYRPDGRPVWARR